MGTEATERGRPAAAIRLRRLSRLRTEQRSSVIRGLTALAVLFGLGIAGLVGTSQAKAAYGFNQYIYNACPPTVANSEDPVNLYFTVNAKLDRVDYHLRVDNGWTQNDYADGDNFVSWGLCQPTHGYRTDDDITAQTRHHIRFQQDSQYDSSAGYVSAGSAHIDTLHGRWDWPPVCHAVEPGDFNNSRNDVIHGMVGGPNPGHGHTYSWINAGNTLTHHQCDGTWSGSDGYVAVITIPN